MALKPMSTFPEPMISVTSYARVSTDLNNSNSGTVTLTLGSFGSKSATLMPSSLKYPLA